MDLAGIAYGRSLSFVMGRGYDIFFLTVLSNISTPLPPCHEISKEYQNPGEAVSDISLARLNKYEICHHRIGINILSPSKKGEQIVVEYGVGERL